MCDVNIIAARDGEDLISLLADGSKDRIDCGPGSEMTWKCEE